MRLKVDISIHVIDNKIKRRYKMPSVIGEIVIGDFSESFIVSLEYWSLDDYKRQWLEGLERIKTHDKSCLIASVQDPKNAPLINRWVLYKEDNKIFVQNQLLVSDTYKEIIENDAFTPENCYKYVNNRRTHTDQGETISEWATDLDSKS